MYILHQKGTKTQKISLMLFFNIILNQIWSRQLHLWLVKFSSKDFQRVLREQRHLFYLRIVIAGKQNFQTKMPENNSRFLEQDVNLDSCFLFKCLAACSGALCLTNKSSGVWIKTPINFVANPFSKWTVPTFKAQLVNSIYSSLVYSVLLIYREH